MKTLSNRAPRSKDHFEALIKQLSNSQLIFEWLLIRTVNQNPATAKGITCFLLTGYEDRSLLMALEEMTSQELINRGLFRFALNQCYKMQTGEISLEQLKLACHLHKPSDLKKFYC
jgi:hypothetical protein